MNTLIAYFSYTGHTKGIAKQLQELTGGTLFEIKPAVPYSEDYDTTERQGRRETRDGYRPPLAYFSRHQGDMQGFRNPLWHQYL